MIPGMIEKQEINKLEINTAVVPGVSSQKEEAPKQQCLTKILNNSVTSGSIASGQIGVNHLANGVAAANISGNDAYFNMVSANNVTGNNLSGNLIISATEGTGGSLVLQAGTMAGGSIQLQAPLKVYNANYDDTYIVNDSIFRELTSGLTYRNLSGTDHVFLLDKVNSGTIASGQVGLTHLASGVLSTVLSSGSVTSGKIGNNAVTSGNIASGQIGKNHLASGVGLLSNNNASGIQLWESGNVFKGLTICGGYDFSPPTNGRLRIQSSDFTNTNAIIELTNGYTTAQVGHRNDGYTRTYLTNTSIYNIELAANDYSTSKVAIGPIDTNVSGKLHVQPVSGMVGCVVQNWAHNKDILQLANASGAILTNVNSSGLLTSKNVAAESTVSCGSLTMNSSGVINLPAISAGSVQAGSIFHDSSNGKLSWKDLSGNVQGLY